ncbi:hypothetical protein HF325_001818 [Metschnikowia pulcherrima]|uniref:Uncharacterized protein n=1 Tax=Metschnikowia pulcherrima TaxID=27326 RepID=A0A8H7GV79_9ASCO|nr:hypothetical protein HF325_001818 [Metschnikowia pulcherrima]
MYFMDCHCHIGVDGHLQDPELLMNRLSQQPRARSRGFFNVMSTYHLDLEFLATLIKLDSNNVLVPYFGVHPWYSHLFSTDRQLSKSDHYKLVLTTVPEDLLHILPDPIYIEDHLEKVMRLIKKCEALQKAYAIGEIGLDKLFRIPSNGFYGNQEHKSGVSLTAAKVQMDHQKIIFLRQLELADKLSKPVSLHCVKAHGPLFDILHASFLNIPAVTLHSYTGSSDQAKRWNKSFLKQQRKLYFSFSNFINGEKDKALQLAELLLLISNDQILFETDSPIDRYFLHNREDEYFGHLHQIQRIVCDLKGIPEADCNSMVQRNSLRLHGF